MAGDAGSWFARLLGWRASPKALAASSPAHSVRQHQTSAHHAVSLAVGRECCRQVESLIGTRFLAGEAPRLPLAGCTVRTCSCRYVHHRDRRMETDRRLRDLWRLGVVNSGDERRTSGRGRRAADQSD